VTPAPQGRILLDVHAHLAPVQPDRLASIEGVIWDETRSVLTVDGHAVGMKALFRPETLRSWMAEQGVERAWVSAPPPLYRQHLRGDEAAAWSACLNDGLEAIALESGGAFEALWHLPVQAPDVAAAIVAAAQARGHALFSMPAGAGDERALSATEFEPLWRALDAAGAFVFVHPGECADGRLSAFYLGNLLGNPYETGVAIAHLVFSGVAERHPNIVFCFAHGGGVAPMTAARWERGYGTARPGIDPGLARPSRLLRRFRVDCICHSEAAIALAEDTFGEEAVLFGSDWPFPMGLPEPHAQMADFAPQRRRRLFCDNPARIVARFGREKRS
jgi:aminocarboxymuconate-semialdehyde decarboxylase